MPKPRPMNMTLAQARAWLAKFHLASRSDALFNCQYGHLGDSLTEGGPCLDEVLSVYPQLDEEVK